MGSRGRGTVAAARGGSNRGSGERSSRFSSQIQGIARRSVAAHPLSAYGAAVATRRRKPNPQRPLRLGEAAELLGVSADTVRRWVDGGKLRARRTAGGQRSVDGVELARFAVANAAARTKAASAHSARNKFPGIVTRIVRDRVSAQVEIQAGPHRLVSLLTREAVDELGLEPGVRAVALVKATHVTVELG